MLELIALKIGTQEPSRAGGTGRYWVLVCDELILVAVVKDARG
jgi:hypothetical protein